MAEAPGIELRGALLPAESNLHFDITGQTVAVWDPPADPAAGALAIAVSPPGGDDVVRPSPGAIDAALRYSIDLSDLAERYSVTGKAGDITVVEMPRLHERSRRSLPWDGLPSTLVFVGVGDASPAALRRAGGALWPVIRAHDTTGVDLGGPPTVAGIDAFVGGLMAASYVRPRFGKPDADAPTPRESTVQILGTAPNPADLAAAAQHAADIGRGVHLARTLADVPSNLKDPAWLAAQVEAVAAQEGLTATIYDEEWLRSGGFGGILAVGQGSTSRPRLVTLSYDPGAADGSADAGHLVIVGKGITFDTGGLAIKPREPMAGMKTDMAGAAAVIGAMVAIARLRPDRRVTAVLPLAENAFSGSAYRAGDVIKMFDGTTVEVTNTDAEGRLVLADSIAWANTALAPDTIVDIATLTGAVRLALGASTAGLFASDDDLARQCNDAASAGGEDLWRLPLPASYQAGLDSGIADVRQTAIDGQHAGSVMAALFLQRFAGTTPWAHLDIAGAARGAGPKQGPTGFGVQTLARLALAEG